jgi:hypothetical protein
MRPKPKWRRSAGVNPRPSGPLNALFRCQDAPSRALGWFVRDQIVFNREVMGCVESTLDA